ncbi:MULTISPECIES: hypothetical protein [unclassified Mycolicibacterium]|uniref:hypothetical protein n=1 Tax=unclassified Mycolicibacterium TaxID=2636767 RepID=UPI00130B7834|nr:MULTISPECIES: hypothetical protein [unclassified Mycolicibacterium]MUL82305.1 hypothetical protein [Mycolicibacterium sp. CBMA 329]MUL88071.1 hypothetical protein [Mycolicibacterium sp. CBMA 331]MUM02401.1 hypothetical protein [Mycolicibacterium sp. CBMA 334]MUM24804.1 hypothetical protein [Mycolicibacterium sp. CBMA 295]MUM38368.1 hypothetical protein [Mycolicibacterium sp. CBMA 247]
MVTAVAMSYGTVAMAVPAGADPVSGYDPVAQYDQPQRLLVVTPVANSWQPQFPFPFDQLQQNVTDTDINAEREMCQWFDAQYDVVRHQIEGLNGNVIRHNGAFDGDGVGQQADIVIANLDQSLSYLTPRVQALTQSYDHAGDMYFPIYQGDSFYGLWQQMSNVSNGLKARQPTWFTGPSYQRMLHWGSKIHRSHVCG